MVITPLSLRPQYLLHHITHATLTSPIRRHIPTYLLDVMTRILRACRNTRHPQQWHVRYIIPHIQYLAVPQPIPVSPLLPCSHLRSLTHIYVPYPQSLIPPPYGLTAPTSDDGYLKPQLHCQLQRITILNVSRAHRYPLRRHRHRLPRQHPVYVKRKRPYPRQQLLEVPFHLTFLFSANVTIFPFHAPSHPIFISHPIFHQTTTKLSHSTSNPRSALRTSALHPSSITPHTDNILIKLLPPHTIILKKY